MRLGPTLLDMDWRGVVPFRVLPPTPPVPSHCQSLDDDGVSTDTSISDKPHPAGGMGVQGAKVAGVVVTLMALTPLGEDERKRMDFQVRSRSPNLEARRAILMMWPVPSGSGPAASRTIMITMRIRTSCPW